MQTIEERLAATASSQFGVISREQLLAIGMTAKMIKHRLRCGSLVRVFPGVYAVGGIELSDRARLLAAQFWLGDSAVVSHAAAAGLWGFDGFDLGRPEITITGSPRRSHFGVVIHHSTQLSPCDVRRRGPFRVTTPERTLVDLGAVASRARVEEALEHVLFHRMSTFERIAMRAEQLCTPGFRGGRVVKRLLDERDPRQAPAESIFETRFYRLLKDAKREPRPQFQHRVSDPKGVVARLDVAYPSLLVAVEAHSLRWHSPRRRTSRDAERHNRLTLLGWVVVLYETFKNLDRRPRQVLNRLEDVLDARLRATLL